MPDKALTITQEMQKPYLVPKSQASSWTLKQDEDGSVQVTTQDGKFDLGTANDTWSYFIMEVPEEIVKRMKTTVKFVDKDISIEEFPVQQRFSMTKEQLFIKPKLVGKDLG